MDTLHAFAIIGIAALIHASFQLSVSVLTLLSGHALGSKKSHAKLLRLMASYISGVGVMTALIMSFIATLLVVIFPAGIPQIAWAVLCGLLFGLSVAVWGFYYRKETGTSLWLPRGFSRHLNDRSKATKYSAEAFGLGLTTVAAELLFIIGPLAVATFALGHLSSGLLQLAGLCLYVVISLLPLLIVAGLVGGGHKLSRIQRWREANKRFLQFVSGAGLLILGFYLYVEQIVRLASSAYGGTL